MPRKGVGLKAASLEMLMMEPEPCSTMTLPTCWVR